MPHMKRLNETTEGDDTQPLCLGQELRGGQGQGVSPEGVSEGVSGG